jgi:DNA-directed RNA polymerase subunit RPC12/RpoP
MAINFTCECGAKFKTGDENAGRTSSCPSCHKKVFVPPAPPLESPTEIFLDAMRVDPTDNNTALLYFTRIFQCIYMGSFGVSIGFLFYAGPNSEVLATIGHMFQFVVLLLTIELAGWKIVRAMGRHSQPNGIPEVAPKASVAP